MREAAMREAPDLDGLREFSTETARDSGRFFVGREAALGRIADAAAGWRRAVSAGQAPFGVVLISGAPGAGKTAILRHVLNSPPKSNAALSMPMLRLSSEATLALSLRNALALPVPHKYPLNFKMPLRYGTRHGGSDPGWRSPTG